MPFNLQRPAISVNRDPNTQVRLWQHPAPLFGPFYKTQTAVGKVVANAEKLQLLRVCQAIQVEVVYLAAGQLVGLDQSEGRALHRARMSGRANEPAAQRRLAGAQVAAQPDTAAPAQRVTNIRAQALH